MFYTFLFITLTTQIKINTPVVITRMNEPDQQLFAAKGQKIRLKTIKEKSYKKNQHNIVTIEEYSPGFFKIRLGKKNYLYKTPNDASVISRIKNGSEIGTVDKDVGFAWEILVSADGYRIMSRALCLQVSGFAEDTESLFLTCETCSDSSKQRFNITKAVMDDSDKKNENENKVILDAYDNFKAFKNKKSANFDDQITNINILVRNEEVKKHYHRRKRVRIVKNKHWGFLK